MYIFFFIYFSMDLLGKWQIRMCKGQDENRRSERESKRVCFKAVCACVIEGWSSCACLTHWLTHTLIHRERRADIAEVPHPLHSSTLSSSSFSFSSTSSLLRSTLQFPSFSSFSLYLSHTHTLTPLLLPSLHWLSKFTGPEPSYTLWAMSRNEHTRRRRRKKKKDIND